ncbi:MAG: acyltransferase family protein [Bilifractor sp.]|jgi:peptidoglycan/LPS O-acetylase OafA/YrhL
MTWNYLSKYRSEIYGCMIIWIVLFHWYSVFADKLNFNWILFNFISQGNVGVDLFLILSGFSIRYALKKYEFLTRSNILSFYKRRMIKLFIPYLFFCIPYLILSYFFLYIDSVGMLIKEMLFVDRHVSGFWFIACIFVCYMISPIIEYLLRRDREKTVIALTILYIIVLGVFAKFSPEFYKYEVLLTRIPAFIFGMLLYKWVSEKRRISIGDILICLSFILFRYPVLYIAQRTPVLTDCSVLIDRLLMGTMGLGVGILLILILPHGESSRINSCLSKVGKVTLEIYVFHIALKDIITKILGPAVSSISRPGVLLIGAAYLPLSILGGFLFKKYFDFIKAKICR